MYEVEVKLPCDPATIRPRLIERGFEPEGVFLQTDRYFASPLRDFASTDEALRVRHIEEKGSSASRVELTYKGPRLPGSTKTRVEECILVDDEEALVNILEALDFTYVATVEKHRERLNREDMTATLDRVTDLGAFIELEVVVPEVSTDVAADRIDEELDVLGFDSSDVIESTYLELLLENSSE